MKRTGQKSKKDACDYMNEWLRHFDVTIEEVMKEHPEWKENSRAFYEAYQVTQEQHDEWYEWAIQSVMKEYKWGRKRAEREFAWVYINVSPMVKRS